MTHYHFIASNVEIESGYLEQAKVEMDEKFEGSKCKVQYILDYNPSIEMLTKVYEELHEHVAHNKQHDYIVLEIAYGLSAEGTPLKVNKRFKLDLEEFRKEHLIDLNEDEMVCVEWNRWMNQLHKNNNQ